MMGRLRGLLALALALLVGGCTGPRGGGAPAGAGAVAPAPRGPDEFERMAAAVPAGADVVLALDLVRLSARLGDGIELARGLAGAGGAAALPSLRWVTVAVWGAGALDARVLTIGLARPDERAGLTVLDAASGLVASGPPELVAAAQARVAETTSIRERAAARWGEARFDPAGLSPRETPALRLVLAATPLVIARLLPLLGPEARELRALRAELHLSDGEGLSLRTSLRAGDEGGAESLAERVRSARATLLARGSVARLGLDRFVAALAVDADGPRARVAYGLSSSELDALRERLRILGEVLRQLRARAAEAGS